MPVNEKNISYCDDMNALFYGQNWFKHVVDEEGRIVVEFYALPDNIDEVGSDKRFFYRPIIWREFDFKKIIADTPEGAFQRLKEEVRKRVENAGRYVNMHIGPKASQHIQVFDDLGEKIEWLLEAICHYEFIFGCEELKEMDQKTFCKILHEIAHNVDDGFSAYIDESHHLILQFPEDCWWDEEDFAWAVDLNGTYMKVDELTAMHINGENGEEMMMNLKAVLNQYNVDDYIAFYIMPNAREILDAVDKLLAVLNNILKALNANRMCIFGEIEQS